MTVCDEMEERKAEVPTVQEFKQEDIRLRAFTEAEMSRKAGAAPSAETSESAIEAMLQTALVAFDCFHERLLSHFDYMYSKA